MKLLNGNSNDGALEPKVTDLTVYLLPYAQVFDHMMIAKIKGIGSLGSCKPGNCGGLVFALDNSPS